MVNCFLEINQPYNAPRVIVSFHSTHPRVKQFQCLIVFFIHHSTHPRIVPRGDCKMYSVPGATQPNLAPEIEIKVYTLLLLLLRILVLNIHQLFFAVLFYLQKKNSQGVLGFRLNTVEKKVFYQLFVFFIFKP